jgi:hypothetical protein
LLSGVEELKNAFQLAVISEMALADPPALGEGPALADGPALGGTAGADTAVGCTCDGAAENDPWAYCGFCVELEQADIAVTITRPRAEARKFRRLGVHRIVRCPLGLGAVSCEGLGWLGSRRGAARHGDRPLCGFDQELSLLVSLPIGLGAERRLLGSPMPPSWFLLRFGLCFPDNPGKAR